MIWFLLYYIISVSGLIVWWTDDLDLKLTGLVLFMVIAWPVGPIFWIIRAFNGIEVGLLFNRHRVVFKKRER